MTDLSEVYSDTEGVSNLYESALLKLQVFIDSSDTELLEEGGQKFVALFRFRETESFGRHACIDVVSRPLSNHRNIALQHVQRVWDSYEQAKRGLRMGEDQQTYFCPYAIAGGFVQRQNDIFRFSGSSGDYGRDLFGGDVNQIAAAACACCGVPHDPSQAQDGQEFFSFVEEFLRSDESVNQEYHERWVYHANTRGAKMTGQQYGAVMYMSLYL